MPKVYHAQGETKNVPRYSVNIKLPNSVGFVGVPVSLGDFSNPKLAADVLIGMDIIGRGDFAVTNFGGKTKFTFRMPSQTHIDFVAEHKKTAAMRKQSKPSQQTRERNRRRRKKGK